MATQLVVIDKSVSGYQSLLSQIPSGYTVLQVDSSSDGWGQIASFLSGQAASGLGGSYSALHILGHGSSGGIQLGASTLSLGNLSSEASAFAHIQPYMAPGADLMLYGCDVAQGAAGNAFVTQLAKVTGWDVAASTNTTGGRGGDWVLEKTVGAVQTQSLSLVLENSLDVTNDWRNVYGTSGNDSLSGSDANDFFDGGAGNDTIMGGKGYWGDGVQFWGATTGVNVNLSTGVALDGQGGVDTLSGIKHVNGTPFNDTLTGNAEINWFRPGAGNDIVDGKLGYDVVMYEDATSAVVVNLVSGTASGTSIGNDTLISIEAVHGSYYDDRIILSNSQSSGGYAFARVGNDTIIGSDGYDNIHPGSGNDFVDGGGSIDELDYSETEWDNGTNNNPPMHGVSVNLATNVAMDPWGGTDTLANLEEVKATIFDDLLIGNGQANKLYASDGNDTLQGGGGFDMLVGGKGYDQANYTGTKIDYTLIKLSDTSYLISDNRSNGDGTDLLDSIETLNFNGVSADLSWATQAPVSGMKLEVNTPMNNFIPQGDKDFDYFTGDSNDKFVKLASFDAVTRAYSMQVVKEYGVNPYYQAGGAGQYGEKYLSGVFTVRGVLGAASPAFPGGVGQELQTGSDFKNWILSSTGTTVSTMTAVAYGSQDGINPSGTSYQMETRTYDKLDIRLLVLDLPDSSQYAGADTMVGNSGNDKLGGFGGIDSMSGGGGDDTLWGGEGIDTLDGGAGLDTADYSEKAVDLSVTLNGATAVRVTVGGSPEDSILNVENIRSGSGNDSLTGDGNANVFTGGDGKDSIDGGAGIDTADYSDKTVAVSVTLNGATAANVTVGATITMAGVVEDSIRNVENVVGGSANDKLTGDSAANVLTGGSGNDWLNGGSGADTLVGGAGDDAYWIDNVNDVITELGSDNTSEQQTFSMGNDNDVAIVSASGYTLTAGAAVEDMMAAGAYTGGTGTDSAINLTGNALGQGLIGNDAKNVLMGMGGDDNLVGMAGDDTLMGGSGNDALFGGTGNDSMLGEDGDDFFAFNLPTTPGSDFNGRPFSAAMTGGADTVDGGLGNDTILLSGSKGEYTVTQNGANAFFITSKFTGESMSFSNVEKLAFGSFQDLKNLVYVPLSAYTTPTQQGDLLSAPDDSDWSADGLGGDDTMTGNGGNDTIRGSAGNDSLMGGAGKDELWGGDGNDTLLGGAGVDRLFGEGGNDSILGGDGGDKFFADISGSDTMDGGAGKDFLTYGGFASGVNVNVSTGKVLKASGPSPATDSISSIEQISGSNFADTIVGSWADEYFEGNDVWWNTRTGTYNLSGDSLDGGGGWDGLGYGGYKYGVSVNLQTERATDQFGVTDTVKGFEGVDGTNFADTIIGSDGNNWIQGDAGYWGQDRSMYGYQSTGDSLDGGGGWDTLGYIDSPSGVRVDLSSGRATDAYGFQDTVVGFEAVQGSNFADTIVGNDGDNWIQGDSGDGGAPRDNAGVSSADSLDGGFGNDTVSYENDVAGVTVDLVAGRAWDGYRFEDTLTGFEAVQGSAYDDVLFGDTGRNTLQGGGGNDSMFGDGGDDEFWADTSGGNDTMDGGDGWDSVYYGSARGGISVDLRNGTVTKPVGLDTLINMDGINATNFADTIIGSSGNDWFQSDASYYGTSRVGITQAQQSSADYIDGGLGNDKIAYGGEAAGVTVNLKTERAIDVFGGEDTVKGIENVAGSNFGDTIIGSDGGNWIKGDAGWGAKRTSGSPSSGDYLDGGAGRDTVSYVDDAAGVTVNLQTGRATDGFGGQDTLVGFEMVEGSSFNDLITGEIGKNSLTGLGGNDTMYGGDGHDTIDGGDGSDLIFGGAGDDSIIATSGSDTIDGGSGSDSVLFDLGNNRFDGLNIRGDANSGWTLKVQDGTVIGTFTPDLGSGAWTFQRNDGTPTTYFSNIETIQLRNSSGSVINVAIDNLSGVPDLKFTPSGVYDKNSMSNTPGYSYIGGIWVNDSLAGSAGNDSLVGGDYSDTLYGSAGNDTLDGGMDSDTLTYQGADNGVVVNLVTGVASSDGMGGMDVVRNIEKLTGSDHNDTITANRFAEVYGGAGDDMLISGDGTAYLRGDAGSDTLIGSDSVTDRAGFSLGSTRIDGMSVTGDSQQGWTVQSNGGMLFGVQFDAITQEWTVQDVRGLGTGQDLGTDVLRNMEVLRINGMDASGNAITASIKLTESGTPSVEMVHRVAVNSSNTSGTSASEYLFGSTNYSGPVDGGGGNDTIATWLGGDTLVGGAGDDYLDGGFQLGLTWRKGNLANTLGDWDTASYTDVSAGGVRVDLSEMKVYELPSESQKAWTRLIGTSAFESGGVIATGAGGSIYAGGWTQGSLDGNANRGSQDGYVTKFDTNGNKAWTHSFASTQVDMVSEIEASADGTVYVVGMVNGPQWFNGSWASEVGSLDGQAYRGLADGFVSKLNADGSTQWTRLQGASGQDATYSVSVGKDGSVYAAGFTDSALNGQINSGGRDVSLIKMSSIGDVLWTRLLGSGGIDEAVGSTVGVDGSIYVTGVAASGLGGAAGKGGTDAFLAKFNTNGDMVWTRMIGGTGDDHGSTAATGLDGSIYVGGRTNGSIGGQSNNGAWDSFLTKYSVDGVEQWTRLIGSSGNEQAGVIMGPDGGIYINGSTDGTLMDGQTNSAGGKAFLAKFTEDGTKLWTRLDQGDASIGGFAIGSDGTVVMAGETERTQGGQAYQGGGDVFVTKYTGTNPLNFNSAGTSGTGTDTLRGIEQINLTRQHDEVSGDFSRMAGNDEMAGNLHEIGISGFGGSDTFDLSQGAQPWQDVWLDYSWSKTAINVTFNGVEGQVNYGAVGVAGTANYQAVGTDTLRHVVDLSDTQFNDSFDFSKLVGSVAVGEKWSWVGLSGGNDTVIGNGYTGVGFNQNVSTLNGDEHGVTVQIGERGQTTTVDMTHLKDGSGNRLGTATLTDINAVDGTNLDDVLIGSSGDDEFTGNGGWDLIDGGSGGIDFANYKRAQFSGITVNLKDGLVYSSSGLGSNVGQDTLRSIEVVQGSNFGDLYDATGFSATSANVGSRGEWNKFRPLGGDDTIVGNGSTVLSYGGYAPPVAVEVNLGTGIARALDPAYRVGELGTIVGTDTFTGVSGVEGSALGDLLIAGNTNATLEGGGGNDTLVGGQGDADVAKYVMDDTAINGLRAVRDGESNTWSLRSNGVTIAELRAAPGDNGALSWSMADTRPDIAAGQVVSLGTDQLTGIERIQIVSRASDSADWSTYTVFLKGTSERPEVVVESGSSFNTILGTNGNDTLMGTFENDSIIGLGGRDFMDGGAGNDTLDGGSNRNMVGFSGATQGVVVDLVAGTAKDGQGGVDTLINIGQVSGTEFADRITVNNGGFADGNGGDDTLMISQASGGWKGLGAGGFLNGGQGNDTLIGTLEGFDGASYDLGSQFAGAELQADGPNQWLFGQAGNNVLEIRFDSSTANWAVRDLRSDAGADSTNFGADTLQNMDLLYLSDGTEAGAGKYFKIDAANGAASVKPFSMVSDGSDINGNSKLVGTSGNDLVFGGPGDDTLVGGAGDDQLVGGEQRDLVWRIAHGGVFLESDNDVADYSGTTLGGVTLNLSDMTVRGSALANTGNDTLRGIENVWLTRQSDTVVGTLADLAGNTENDQHGVMISGYGGSDTLINGMQVNVPWIDGSIGPRVSYAWSKTFINAVFSGDSGTVSYGASVMGNAGQAAGVDSLRRISAVSDSAFDDSFDFRAMTGTARPDDKSNVVYLSSGNDRVLGNGDTQVRFLTNVQGDRGIEVRLAPAGQTFTVDMTHLSFNGTTLGVATLSGVDGVRGTNLNDTLVGGAYDDYEFFRGAGGDDLIDGKGGIDLADYWASNTGVTVKLAEGTASSDVAGNNIGHDTLRSIERVRGTDFDDVFDARGFSLWSNPLPANLGSYGAWNEFQGLGGNDTIYGNSATTLSYDKSSIGVDVNMGSGIGQALDPANRSGELAQIVGTDTFSGVSILSGSALADKLTGGGAGGVVGYGDVPAEFFMGGAGNDTIDGQLGRDQVEYRFATAGIVADLRTGQVQDGQGGVDTLRGIEVIAGSKYDDVMLGSDDNNSWASPVLNLRVDLGLPAKALDSLYVTGMTAGNLDGQSNTAAGGDVFLTKLGLGDGKAVLWTKLLGVGANLNSGSGDASTPTHTRMGAVATAADGSVYVTGQTDATSLNGQSSSGATDAYLMKYASDGSLQWTRLLGSAGSETALGVTVDDSGAVYITGQTDGDMTGNGNAGGNDAYIAKFESDGTRAWINTLGSDYEERGFSVTASGSGDVYVTGYSTGVALDGQTHFGNIDVFLTKYAADGSKVWTQLLGSSEVDAGYAVDSGGSDGSVVVAGASWGDQLGSDAGAGGVDAFVTKYSAEGTVLWTHLLGTSANDEAWSLATGADGSIYVVGETWGTLDGAVDGAVNKGSYDAYLTKYSATGDKQWTQLLGTAGADIAHTVAVGADGNIYVSGETFGSLQGNANKGGSDAFVAQFTADGVRQWTNTLATAADDVAYGIAASSGQENPNPDSDLQLTKVATTADGSVYYAVTLNGGKVSHDVLDALFNKGLDTTDAITSRTFTHEAGGGGQYVLLSSGELKSLLPTLDQTAMPTGWNALWTSTQASAGQHIAVSSDGKEIAQSDSMANYVVVKVQPPGIKQESFAGGQGNDTIDGGGGYDEVLYNYGNPNSGVNVNLATGVAQDGFGTVDTLYSVEGVEGSDFNDTIVGNFANNRIEGRDGNDSLDGGAGVDWVEYTHASASVRVDLTQGRTSGAAGNDTLSSFENVEGSGSADTLIGNALANAFKGNQGDDTIDGGAGVDTAVYDGNYGDYTITRTGQLVSVSRNDEGVDTLVSIEKLQFADRVYELNSAPTGAIKITGTMAQNKILTVNTGTLADADGLGTLRYQWQADGVDIKNATGTTFTLTQAQVGKAMGVYASYTDGYGNQESVTSALGAKVANVNDAPTGFVKVMGQTLQGQTLQALNTLNDADGMGPVSYQWYADAAQISGATGTTFKLSQAEVGKAITLKASYTDGFKQLETVWSPSTEAVANVNDLPEGLPTITGDLWVGGTTLGVQTSDIKDADSTGPLSGFQYQWLADGDAIDGATAATFALTNDLVGRSVSVQVRYLDGGNTEESVLSVGSAPIAAKETAGQVALSGVFKQGQLIQAAVSDDDGVTGSVAWKWFANGQEIVGQTASTLQLGQAHVAKVITAQASYTDGHRNVYAATGTGVLTPVLSAASVRVVNVNDAPTGAVTITGTATQNQTLTANNTLADIDGMGTLNYQWQANGVNIAGENAATLRLVSQSLAGKKISVTVSYTDGFGTLESKSSAATNAVLDVNDAPTGSIAISGNPVVGGSLTASSDTLRDADGPVGKVAYTWTMTDPAGGAAKVIGTAAQLSFSSSTYLNKNISVQATYSDGTFTNTVAGPVIRVGGATADSIAGSGADDRLYGNDGNDTVSGLVGNDILYGGIGNDSLTGGAGNDIFNVDSGTDTITDLGSGADVLVVSSGATANVTMAAAWTATAQTVNSGVVNISTNGFAVNLAAATGTAGFNVTNTAATGTTLTGSALANTLTSGAGNDTLVGGAGNDTYVVNASTDVVTELADGGTDSVLSSATYTLSNSNSNFVEGLTLTGTTAINGTGNDLNNTLNGNSAVNVLIGGVGDDTLRGDGGNDSLTGGTGNDTFTVDIGTDTITDFGLGADILTVSTGATANVTMAGAWTATASTVNNGTVNISTNGFAVDLAAATGTAGFNVTNTGSGGTTLTGSALANTLSSGAGNDTLVGGAGNDTYIVNSASDMVTEVDGGGTDLVSSSASYTLSGYVENLTLTGPAAIDAAGNELANTLIGNTASNVIDGAGGNDTLTGGLGVDTFKVTQGTDTVTDLGNGGADVLVVSAGATANVNLAAAWTAAASTVNRGTVTINTNGFAVNLAAATGTAGFNVIGGAGADTLGGSTFADTLTGGSGNDTFNITSGTDTVTDLGNGADVLVVSVGATANVTMAAAWIATSATTNNGTANISTNGFAVNLALASGSAGFNVTNTGTETTSGTTLTGSRAANTLTSGAGNDTLVGGAGNDTYVVNASTDVVTELANAGVDLVSSSATYTLSANVENLTLTGSTAINGTGNELSNTIFGNSAINALSGGSGDDTLRGYGGNDSLTGGLGNDTFNVDIGADTITDFGSGTDVLVVSVGATANVTMAAAWTATAATINNGTANISTNGFAVNLLAATGSFGYSVTNTSATGTTMTSGIGNDTLTGGTGNDIYVINSAQDLVKEGANGGTDLIQLTSLVSSYVVGENVENIQLMESAGNSGVAGNAINNLIYMNGNIGASSIDGAAGTDTLSYFNAAIAGVTSATTLGVTLNLGGTVNATGYVTASGAFGADQVKGIENLVGSAYADTLTGTSLDNSLAGGAGNDSLSGELGKDTLSGGLGADKFLFNVLETTANRDTISDFLGSEGDKIQFSKSVFAGFANVGTITTPMLAVDGAAQTTSTRLIYSSTTGVLSYDADGSGAGQAVEVALIGVTTHATLNATHFEIVA